MHDEEPKGPLPARLLYETPPAAVAHERRRPLSPEAMLLVALAAGLLVGRAPSQDAEWENDLAWKAAQFRDSVSAPGWDNPFTEAPR